MMKYPICSSKHKKFDIPTENAKNLVNHLTGIGGLKTTRKKQLMELRIREAVDILTHYHSIPGCRENKISLKGDGNDEIGIHKIRKWLQNQDDYSLQKPVRRRFQRARVVMSGPKEQLDIDLADMQSLSKDNDGVRFLLVAVDLFSLFAWVVPLKR
ncbi:unnamed protein product [Mytilus coruscus]|uniref:Uncharacterized protein n=1 Tax=Mytilus coruscus TaxID=42192 RepID=A0A6J8CWY7_MYTCO|nr:unnamed protein product [Mytilus coruscus]